MPPVESAGKSSASPSESPLFGGVDSKVANGMPAVEPAKLERARQRFNAYYPELAHDDEEFAEVVKRWAKLGSFEMALWVTDYCFAERPIGKAARS